MLVCEECARFGEIIPEPEHSAVRIGYKVSAAFEKQREFEQLLLFDDFAQRIKRARESKQLLFEDLSRLVGEKASVLKHIESGQLQPTLEIAKRLERTLGVQIIEKS